MADCTSKIVIELVNKKAHTTFNHLQEITMNVSPSPLIQSFGGDFGSASPNEPPDTWAFCFNILSNEIWLETFIDGHRSRCELLKTEIDALIAFLQDITAGPQKR